MGHFILQTHLFLLVTSFSFAHSKGYDFRELKFINEYVKFYKKSKEYRKLTIEQNGTVSELAIPRSFVFYNESKYLSQFLATYFQIGFDSTKYNLAFYGSDFENKELLTIQIKRAKYKTPHTNRQTIPQILEAKLEPCILPFCAKSSTDDSFISLTFKQIQFFNNMRLNKFHDHKMAGKIVFNLRNSNNTDAYNWVVTEVFVNAFIKIRIDYFYPTYFRYNYLLMAKLVNSVHIKQIIDDEYTNGELQILSVEHY